VDLEEKGKQIPLNPAQEPVKLPAILPKDLLDPQGKMAVFLGSKVKLLRYHDLISHRSAKENDSILIPVKNFSLEIGDQRAFS
jgi:hypothetical protein